MVLSGHEHTSIVEGGVIFGRSLSLPGGMFLDHHQVDYSSNWYKLLEINNEDNPEKVFVDERWFLYSNAKRGSWEEQKKFSVRYRNWKKICQSLNDESPKENESTSQVPTSDQELKNFIREKDDIEDIRLMLNEFVDLLGGDEVDMQREVEMLKDGVFEADMSKKGITKKLFLINNIDDFFLEKVGENLEMTYLCALFSQVGSESDEVYVIYTYQLTASLENNKSLERRVGKLIQAKFEQFRNKIFRNEICINKFRNAKFAIRH